MLSHVTWEFNDMSEENAKRSLSLLKKWTPGPGQFLGFYGFCDGMGGMALIEVENAADLAKTLAPWMAELTFTTRPILPIQETAEINAEALGWRDAN